MLHNAPGERFGLARREDDGFPGGLQIGQQGRDARVDLVLKQALRGEILPKGADGAVCVGGVQPHQLPEGGDKRRAEKAAQRFLAGDGQSQLAAGVTHRV